MMHDELVKTQKIVSRKLAQKSLSTTHALLASSTLVDS
jgi:hypothetical protein